MIQDISFNVPELWRFENENQQINLLQNGIYVESTQSYNFPQLSLCDVIPQYLQQSKTAGRNTTLKAFRQWIRKQI